MYAYCHHIGDLHPEVIIWPAASPSCHSHHHLHQILCISSIKSSSYASAMADAGLWGGRRRQSKKKMNIACCKLPVRMHGYSRANHLTTHPCGQSALSRSAAASMVVDYYRILMSFSLCWPAKRALGLKTKHETSSLYVTMKLSFRSCTEAVPSARRAKHGSPRSTRPHLH